jgi:hypothetical protein
MIQSKKTVEEYVFEFVSGVLLNQSPPVSEYMFNSSFLKEAEPTFDDSSDSQSIRSAARFLRFLFRQGNLLSTPLGLIPSSKGVFFQEKMKAYVSPAFPNNLVTPEQFDDFAQNQFLQVYYFLQTKEIKNGDAITVEHSIVRQYIFVENLKFVDYIERSFSNLAENFYNFILDSGGGRQNSLGYPIQYNKLRDILR